MGTPTRGRHYLTQSSDQRPKEADRQNVNSTAPSPSDVTHPQSPKAPLSGNSNQSNTASRSSFAHSSIARTTGASNILPTSSHMRTASTETANSTTSASHSIASSTSTSSSFPSGNKNGNASNSSAVASWTTANPCHSSSSPAYRANAQRPHSKEDQTNEERVEGSNGGSASLENERNPPTSANAESKISRLSSSAASFVDPWYPSCGSGESDPFRSAYNQPTIGKSFKRPVGWMSSVSTPHRAMPAEQILQTSTPARSAHSRWNGHPSSALPTTPSWPDSPVSLAPLDASQENGGIGEPNHRKNTLSSPSGASSFLTAGPSGRPNAEALSPSFSMGRHQTRHVNNATDDIASSFSSNWHNPINTPHFRSCTESTNNSSNNDGHSYNTSFDPSFRSIGDTTGDTSASLQDACSSSYNLPSDIKLNPDGNTTSIGHRHARQVSASHDGSLYSFDGLAELSSRSFDIGREVTSASNGALRPTGEDIPLSSISDLNLDDSGYGNSDDQDVFTARASSAKIGADGQIILDQKEQSDLDRLYQRLQIRNGASSRPSCHHSSNFTALPASAINNNVASSTGIQNSLANEDINFPKNVRDAYKNIRLNEETNQTRYLFVDRLPVPKEEDGQTLVNEITEAIKIYGQLRGIYVRHLIYTGCSILSFHDSRHANTARNNILRDSRRNPAWGYRQLNASFIEREEVIKLAEGQFTTSFLSLGEGKLSLLASKSFQYDGLKAYFSALGDVKHFDLDPTFSSLNSVDGKQAYVIEYFDDRCASRAWLDITQAENADLQIGWRDTSSLNVHLADTLISPQIDANKKILLPLPSSLPSYPDDRSTRYKKTTAVWDKTSSTPSSAAFRSPEGFRSATALAEGPFHRNFSSAPVENDHGNRNNGRNRNSGFSMAHLGYVPNDPSRNSTAQWGLIRDDPVPDNNIIRFDRIMSGEDKRTSCILRNLPNRMTQLELMENLDQVVPREYDFLYLRFDFNTGSNCSYSFINFTSSDALLRFWKARLGTFWDESNSRKLCMGGMAAIQGKAALIERFRNSSVMDAKEEYRPKIFYSSGPMKGLPEPFPLSNNAMRKARSTYATNVYGRKISTVL